MGWGGVLQHGRVERLQREQRARTLPYGAVRLVRVGGAWEVRSFQQMSGTDGVTDGDCGRLEGGGRIRECAG